MFKRVNRNIRKDLKEGLRQNGVFIRGGTGLPEQFIRVLQEERQAEWTMEEREKEIAIAEGKGIL